MNKKINTMKKLTLVAALLLGAICINAQESKTGQQKETTVNNGSVYDSNRNASSEKVTTQRTSNPAPQQQSQPSTNQPNSTRYGERKTTPEAAQNNSNRSSGKASPQ
ncbi:hypothetical protein B0A69_13810 [Chryseobacterium shigense]|nr:hypothetical protein B0A69_13810 [Chryseobacterium shigense]